MTPPSPDRSLPATAAFAATDVAYLDNGAQHPISLGARAAADAYLDRRMVAPRTPDTLLDRDGLRAKFARLVNVAPAEIALVQGTTAAEHMVVQALGLPMAGAHIVVDTLHFFGSVPLYQELARRGCEVSWVRPVDGRIRLEDLRAAVRPDTRLVAVSAVSTINGFQHDLAAVSAIAHAVGAFVYADIIHACGTMPFDLDASGVDFAATASYKWLMGDFGIGFLYIRQEVLARIDRVFHGYFGLESFASHAQPLDPPPPDGGSGIADYRFRADATGAFALGTHASAAIAMLHHSLDVVEALGTRAIQAHAQSLVAILKRELPRRGYRLMTPPETTSPIVTGLLADARGKLAARMDAAGVRLTIVDHRFRITPSIQNDERDIARFLDALPPA